MNAATAGESLPDFLGDEREKRCCEPGEGLEHRVQRVEGVSAVAAPEATATATHVPVGENVAKIAERVRGERAVQVVKVQGDIADDLASLSEQIAVEHVGRVSAKGGGVCGSVGVQREKVVAVPERQHELAHSLADALLGHHEVAPADYRRRHQVPAHRIRAISVEDLGDVRIVAERLRHLLAVAAEHDAVTDHVAKGGSVEQRGRQHMQHVEPAARLPDVLDDEVRRVVLLENLRVFKGVVNLRERHRPGVEPHVEYVFDPTHRRPARWVVGIRARELIDEWPVQIRLAGCVAWQIGEVGFELGERSVDVDTRILRVVALPDRDR